MGWEKDIDIEAELRGLAEKRKARETAGTTKSSDTSRVPEDDGDLSIEESMRLLIANKAKKDRDEKVQRLMKKRHMSHDDAEVYLKRHPNVLDEHEPIDDWSKLSPEEFRKQSLLRYGI